MRLVAQIELSCGFVHSQEIFYGGVPLGLVSWSENKAPVVAAGADSLLGSLADFLDGSFREKIDDGHGAVEGDLLAVLLLNLLGVHALGLDRVYDREAPVDQAGQGLFHLSVGMESEDHIRIDLADLADELAHEGAINVFPYFRIKEQAVLHGNVADHEDNVCAGLSQSDGLGGFEVVDFFVKLLDKRAIDQHIAEQILHAAKEPGDFEGGADISEDTEVFLEPGDFPDKALRLGQGLFRVGELVFVGVLGFSQGAVNPLDVFAVLSDASGN